MAKVETTKIGSVVTGHRVELTWAGATEMDGAVLARCSCGTASVTGTRFALALAHAHVAAYRPASEQADEILVDEARGA